ncbi:MAG: ATP-binding protein [Candidatus Omnitrophica bacterium]|nr:ATP-binding protein [Candidatus Omnitrophota bacterium]HOX54311.1 ATP-binding protein [Candidatus Omnitrophota bacterium]
MPELMQDFLTTMVLNVDFQRILNIIGFLALFAVIVMGVILAERSKQANQLKQSLSKMKNSFDQLDAQAKLIVKTDLELNKTQEELDKKITALFTLQKISRLLSTTLDEQEIFRRSQSIASELGFERCFIIAQEGTRKFSFKMSRGYQEVELNKIINLFESDPALIKVTKEGGILSSSNISDPNRNRIATALGVIYFIIAPIITQDGIEGALLVGNNASSSLFTEGEEETIAILATQLGQSLENARLFEQVYSSHHELEAKIKERTKELADALEELKKISKMKSDFVSAVSHELRTPLTSIKGYASILIDGKAGDVPDFVKERLEKINKHSDGLVRLINDLLDISRIESGKVEMKFESENIKDIVENVADLLAPQTKEKQIQLAIEIPDNLTRVYIDHSQVERVFINLVGNALKFTPQNGKIIIRAKESNGNVQIDIEDNGIGIPEDAKENIFSEFYRVDNIINQSLKGTGLGLTLVKYIVEAHKGRIWVESQPNKGSRFSFTLPKA